MDAVPDENDSEDLAAAAVAHLQRAATRASALGVPAEAAGHLSTALSRTTEPDARPGIELELARQLSRTGDHEGALAHATSCRDAFDARGDAVAAGDAVAVMTRVLASFAHEYETSIALAEERLKALRGRDDASTVVLALLKNLIGARLDTGADFGSLCEEQQALAERGEDEFEIADAFISYALHYDRVGARHLSRTLLQAAADIAQRLHDPHMRTMALVNISAMWVGSDVDTAADSGREAVREAHGLGELTWSSVSAINLFNSLLLQGSWTEAEELSRSDARHDLDEVYWTLGDSYISLTKGEVLAAEPEEAGSVQAPTRVAFAHLHRAVVLVSRGDPAAAQIAVDALRQMEALVGLSDDFVLAYLVALDVLTRLDERAGLRALDDLVDAHHPGTHSRGVRALRSHRRAVVAIQEGADGATVEGHLRSALTDAQAWHAGTVEARITADLGVWLTQQGRADEAAEPLEIARTHFSRHGRGCVAGRPRGPAQHRGHSESVMRTCPSCATPGEPENARFCFSCAHPVGRPDLRGVRIRAGAGVEVLFRLCGTSTRRSRGDRAGAHVRDPGGRLTPDHQRAVRRPGRLHQRSRRPGTRRTCASC